MQFENILYSVNDGVATLTLNRPEVSNGFNVPMCEEILKAIELAAEDKAVQILLINANGKVFSVGGDLAEMQRAVKADDIQSLVKIAELVNEISYSMKQLSKPVIMSVDGPVAGAAANMVVAADFCIATERSRFIQAFVGVGLAPDAGGLYLLARAIGVTRATQLAMTGEPLNAEKALNYGLLYKVCEVEKLETTTNQVIKNWYGRVCLLVGMSMQNSNYSCRRHWLSQKISKKGCELMLRSVDQNFLGSKKVVAI